MVELEMGSWNYVTYLLFLGF